MEVKVSGINQWEKMMLKNEFKMKVKAFILSGICILCSLLIANDKILAGGAGLVDYVNPLQGTNSSFELSRGNTYPAISLPFGMTAWTPQTGEWRWIYTFNSNKFQGMRATHQPSPWVGDYGQFTIMPMVGTLKIKDEDRASFFRHANEISKPYYYSVLLETYNIKTEITPTMRCALMRITFPKSESAFILLDASAKLGYVKIIPEQKRIEGYTRINSGGVPENFACYFVCEFDKDFADFGTTQGDGYASQTTEKKGMDVGAYIGFKTEENEIVNLKIATSFISLEQAERNLNNEIGTADFEEIKLQAQKTWNAHLGKVQIESKDVDKKVTFYTALYRMSLFPRVWYELDENGQKYHFSPYDGQVHPGPLYADTGFWDTFRALFPFHTIMFPQREAEMLEGFVNAYKEGGRFPKWTSPGYRGGMIATHSASVIADAYIKGIRGFDAQKAYEGMVKDAMEPLQPGEGGGRWAIDDYKKLGYVPNDVEGSVSRTLEFAYDDFCVAQMAKALGKEDDYQYFMTRAMNYQNVFDPTVGFMRAKNKEGEWQTPFSPIEWGGPYVEGSAWHYTWTVMQDPQGLINLFGGTEKFVGKLDALFTTPPDFEVGSYGHVIHEMTEMVLCNMGQYAHGNQPVHHVIYLYNYAGQPWKTQERVRQVMETLYGPGYDGSGLCGDEDNGQTSAWYVFSALGFYPVSPGRAEYAIGSPLFPKATLYLPDGKQFVITAQNNSSENKYIQSVTLNGVPYNKSYITHEDIISGGEITFAMGNTPNKEWATTRENFPHSISEVSAAMPFIPVETVSFFDSVEITLKCETEGARIYYTLDGTDPDQSSLLYEKPFTLYETTQIKARAFKEGLAPSPVFSKKIFKTDNYARIAVAMASGSTNNKETGSMAIDGNLETKWCCEAPCWLLVKLPEKTELNYFVVKHAGAGEAPWGTSGHGDSPELNTAKFFIQIPDTTGGWQNIVSVDNNPGTSEGNVTRHFLGKPVKTNRVRLFITDPGADKMARIYEFEMYNKKESKTGKENFGLLNNYPNPFNQSTTINYFLQKSGTVRLDVYNTLGERVKTLVKNKLENGWQAISWDGKNKYGNPCSVGVYFCVLDMGAKKVVKKMVLLH